MKRTPQTELEVELAELRRLSRKTRLLELPATIYSQHASSYCEGICETPTVLTGEGLSCCHFYLLHQMHRDAVRLERLQRSNVEFGRNKLKSDAAGRIEGAGLQETYPRTHSGTYKLKALKVDDGRLKATSHSPQVHHKKSTGKP